VIRAEKAFHPRLGQNSGQELGGDVALKQAIAVLGKRRVVPDRVVSIAGTLTPGHSLLVLADRTLVEFEVKTRVDCQPLEELGGFGGDSGLDVPTSRVSDYIVPG
jgi:hypothetical protein